MPEIISGDSKERGYHMPIANTLPTGGLYRRHVNGQNEP